MPTYKVINGKVKAFGRFPSKKDVALRESIRKWKWLTKYIQVHPRRIVPQALSGSCSLCAIYLRVSCQGCPVYRETKQVHCEGTPYILYVEKSKTTETENAVIAAQAEVLFLESLVKRLGT